MKTILVNLAAIAIGFGLLIGRVSTNNHLWGADTETASDHATETIDFKNDLIPMFTKLGCNTGKCHGSAIGRGDFRLSLYGGTPKADYDEIVRNLGGRRINFTKPESSLLFRKPADLIDHGGGEVIVEGDQNAERLIKWIKQGANYVEHRRLKSIEAIPSRFVAENTGDKTSLKVVAHYDDGLTRDVTNLTQFMAEDTSAIQIDPITAEAKTVRPGRHVVIARYSTKVIPIEFVIPLADKPTETPEGIGDNFIDRNVINAITELRLPLSPQMDDMGFTRRVTLDLTGRLPEYPQKFNEVPVDREAIVDALLASESFIEFYALKLSKLFRIQSKIDKNKTTTTPEAARAFHQWLAQQLRQNVGYDHLTKEILTAKGDSSQYGPATFFTAVEDARLQTEFVTEVFMGSRMKCANCHNHPLDKWTQDDFHGLTAMFSKLTRGQIIRLNPIGKNIHPVTGQAALMKIPGEKFLPADTEDGRATFAKWLTDQNNPYFAKAIVNRLWKSMMGRGLVEPVDDFRSTNPATHPILLNQLADDFVRHGYDIRHTLKTIAMSSSYARQSAALKGNESDDRFYSHALKKPLEPEVLADALTDVLGVVPQYGDETPGTRAVQLRDGSIESDDLDILGRCDRTHSCEGAPAPTGPLAQKLHLFNGGLLNRRVAAAGGRLDQQIQLDKKPMEIVNDFYKTALFRQPNDQETQFLSSLLDEETPSAQQRDVLEDIVWSIVTCQEFVTNH